MQRMKAVRLGAVLAGTALVAAACSSGDSGDGGGGPSIEMVGAPGGANGDALAAEIQHVADELGIDVRYDTLPDFDTVIQSRVRGNNAPDLALFPQPGVLLDLSADMVPLDDLIDVDAATADLIPGLAEIAVGEDGMTYGLPASINVKSNVWFPVTEFADAGYQAPTTHAELVALTEQIKNDGTPPWCFAFESQAATGWYVTDWIEEYVLRIGGPDVYDQWVSHEIPFNDPVVKQAAETFEQLVLAPGNAVLTRQAMAAIPWADGVQPLVADPPGCFMVRQGNFIIGTWPPEVQADTPAYADSFLLPPVVDGGWQGGQPVLGGGDLLAAFTDSPEVAQIMEYIFSPQFGSVWSSTEGSEFVSPYTTFDTSNYLSETYASIGQKVADADAFRFDGSDLMPGQVGSGSFWTEMTAWVTEQISLDQALQNIDNTWPTS